VQLLVVSQWLVDRALDTAGYMSEIQSWQATLTKGEATGSFPMAI
jgi:hypothetical protein